MTGPGARQMYDDLMHGVAAAEDVESEEGVLPDLRCGAPRAALRWSLRRRELFLARTREPALGFDMRLASIWNKAIAPGEACQCRRSRWRKRPSNRCISLALLPLEDATFAALSMADRKWMSKYTETIKSSGRLCDFAWGIEGADLNSAPESCACRQQRVDPALWANRTRYPPTAAR